MSRHTPILILSALLVLVLGGCNLKSMLDEPQSNSDIQPKEFETDKSAYYEQFYQAILKRRNYQRGTTETIAIDGLPKGHGGEVNWSAAVVEGYIDPKNSLDPNEPEDEMLNLNIFIEAKTPLMSNVVFPHSIHTYWLSCQNCHPGIFIPQAGANPITMNEIFEGKWCGRCHGKVAFNFFPLANCRRCHIVMKGKSMDREHWR